MQSPSINNYNSDMATISLLSEMNNQTKKSIETLSYELDTYKEDVKHRVEVGLQGLYIALRTSHNELLGSMKNLKKENALLKQELNTLQSHLLLLNKFYNENLPYSNANSNNNTSQHYPTLPNFNQTRNLPYYSQNMNSTSNNSPNHREMNSPPLRARFFSATDSDFPHHWSRFRSDNGSNNSQYLHPKQPFYPTNNMPLMMDQKNISPSKFHSQNQSLHEGSKINDKMIDYLTLPNNLQFLNPHFRNNSNTPQPNNISSYNYIDTNNISTLSNGFTSTNNSINNSVNSKANTSRIVNPSDITTNSLVNNPDNNSSPFLFNKNLSNNTAAINTLNSPVLNSFQFKSENPYDLAYEGQQQNSSVKTKFISNSDTKNINNWLNILSDPHSRTNHLDVYSPSISNLQTNNDHSTLTTSQTTQSQNASSMFYHNPLNKHSEQFMSNLTAMPNSNRIKTNNTNLENQPLNDNQFFNLTSQSSKSHTIAAEILELPEKFSPSFDQVFSDSSNKISMNYT